MTQTTSRLRLIRTVAEQRSARAQLAGPVGFVPTMGALHAGHESLARRARDECASVVASIFVNPLQFGPSEDFANYPRTFERDVALLESAGVDVIFAPDVAEMLAQPPECTVDPGPLARHFEGEHRPGHFRGVATMVLKLFNVVEPQRAYFGKKDAQQLAIVKRMTSDFNLPIEIVECATVRAEDGLALSSRNAYLNPEERREAPKLYQALRHLARCCSGRACATDELAALLAETRALLPPLRSEYLAVVDPQKFEPLTHTAGSQRLLAVGAATLGTTRLIDNVDVEPAP